MEAKERDKMFHKGVGCSCCPVQLRLQKVNTEQRPRDSVAQFPLVISESAVSSG